MHISSKEYIYMLPQNCKHQLNCTKSKTFEYFLKRVTTICITEVKDTARDHYINRKYSKPCVHGYICPLRL